jgi:hypothetical protein
LRKPIEIIVPDAPTMKFSTPAESNHALRTNGPLSPVAEVPIIFSGAENLSEDGLEFADLRISEDSSEMAENLNSTQEV